jgi:tRNA threonylcarbamoyladenosine biosynthesis protein TsaE
VPLPQPLLEGVARWPDEPATGRAAAALAQALLAQRHALTTHGFTLWLSGDLGAGKTALVRRLLQALGHTGSVKSPTYTLLEPYTVSSLNFYHFDFYRFADPEEFEFAGFRELFGPGCLCAVEWPEQAAGFLSAPDLRLALSVAEPGRQVLAQAFSERGVPCLQAICPGLASGPTSVVGG